MTTLTKRPRAADTAGGMTPEGLVPMPPKNNVRRGRPPTRPVADRLWEKVDRLPNGCWEWTASLRKNGYGSIQVNGRKELAHRVAYEIANGAIPEGKYIDHLCRNKACINPAHLEAVSPAENIRRGDSAKITAETAQQIRDRVQRGEPQRKLAREFEVSDALVSMIVNGSRWAAP